MGSLWVQLLLQFSTKLFETFKVFLSWSQGVHVIWINPHVNVCQFFLPFPLSFFLGLITIRILNLCLQLLQFSTYYYDILQTYSSCSGDMHLNFFTTFSMFCFSSWLYCPMTLLEGTIKRFKTHNPLLIKPWWWGMFACNRLLFTPLSALFKLRCITAYHYQEPLELPC